MHASTPQQNHPAPAEPAGLLTLGPRRSVLLGRSRAELSDIVRSLGQPAYRGAQIARWLYERRAVSFEAMTDLPRDFRALLAEKFDVGRPVEAARSEAPDLTTKLLLELRDGLRVETVLLPYEDRSTVCVSSQVGCAAGCEFCATATMGFVRDLTPGEIVGQVLAASDVLASAPWRDELPEGARRVNHVVFMGMGEPLWNLDNVLEAVTLLNEEVGIGMRGITLSTVGIPDAMRTLADMKLQTTLAVSLHAGTEETRQRLVPTARKFPIDEVISAARYYHAMTGRRVTFEYVLLGGVNDTEAEAITLSRRLRGAPAHVNLIPWNPAHSRMRFQKPRSSDIWRFRDILEEAGIVVTQRMERGQGIDAACGQLVVQAAAEGACQA